MPLTKFSEEQSAFIRQFSSTLYLSGGETWHYIPMWFKGVDVNIEKNSVDTEQYIFETCSFDQLPEYVKAHIQTMRGEEPTAAPAAVEPLPEE